MRYVLYRYTAALTAKNIITFRANSFFNGRIDVLVNNAGVSPVLPIDTVMKVCDCEIGLVGYFFPSNWSSDKSLSDYQVNFDGVLLGAQLFAEKQSIESGWSEKFPIKKNTISK